MSKLGDMKVKITIDDWFKSYLAGCMEDNYTDNQIYEELQFGADIGAVKITPPYI